MARPARLTIELERGSEPISGRIRDERGTRPFVGWLELATELQAAVDTDLSSVDGSGDVS